MAFIGKKPTAAPLTSSDVADGIITNAKLAQDIISADTALGAEPADTDEFLVLDAGVLKRMDYSYIKAAGGIANAQQWRVNTEFTGTADPITANWEEVDTDGYGRLGTTVASSSGIFTFPSTGYWLIDWRISAKYTDDIRYFAINIATTTDNSSYDNAAYAYGFIQNTQSAATFNHASCCFLFDVTSTSTHKCRFGFTPNSESATFMGSTDQNMNVATFLKLGDT